MLNAAYLDDFRRLTCALNAALDLPEELVSLLAVVFLVSGSYLFDSIVAGTVH